MRNGRLDRTKDFKLFVSLLVLLSLVMAFGCAPKKIRVYESAPVSEVRENLVQYAATLLGKPYRNAAKGPDAFDCSGLVYHVFKRFDIAVPNSTNGINRAGYQVSRDDILAGDLVIFTIKKDFHVGIMINRREFIHASTSRGVAVDSVDANYWRRSFSHFRRVL